MVIKVVDVEVDIDIEPSDLSPYDIAEWFDSATSYDLKILHALTNTYTYTDMISSLCNELDRHGVESFLKAFVYEVSKIDMDSYHLINQRVTDYLNNKNS